MGTFVLTLPFRTHETFWAGSTSWAQCSSDTECAGGGEAVGICAGELGRAGRGEEGGWGRRRRRRRGGKKKQRGGGEGERLGFDAEAVDALVTRFAGSSAKPVELRGQRGEQEGNKKG